MVLCGPMGAVSVGVIRPQATFPNIASFEHRLPAGRQVHSRARRREAQTALIFRGSPAYR